MHLLANVDHRTTLADDCSIFLLDFNVHRELLRRTRLSLIGNPLH